MIKILKQIWAVTKVSARSNLAYPGEVLGRTVFMAVILYIFLKLWQATYSQSGATRLGDMTLAQMLWYLTITESIYMSAPRLTRQVDEDVRTGTLAVRLIKPMSYPLYCISFCLGERSVRFVFNLLIGAVITFCLVGAVPVSPFSLAMLAVACLFGFILDAFGQLIVGLGAFWLEDTSGLFLIYTRLVMIFGGMLIPLELFPHWLKEIVVFTPFPYLVYGPVHLFLHPSLTEFVVLLKSQLICILALGLVAAFVYGQAKARICAHGG
ncbi:MAG: ABC-2 family transporter protein [Candidatus Obscuribacter sp.]|jgi:ABC-2 type transport system permease protein|nr:ABC-2 family transporter protein [Candidatus Obscuribacter sp.]MDQ5967481.1 family transporter protein [Cyanobacteriota bacterium erpe_2018_sw_39hr_WHONDRS-SW48-000098_B_bin.30]MBK9205062.1 ABC-2 family transporter protein [Candidatus Obscuribacter sp.]MBK9620322.1 ABC-2 family transporter protein [Candidatus Obscuribacter sp.]MBK9773482.1 ABC-2 family transporter protein [Candidatus Obscuribacter sp.]